jgi:hypothetical protein
MAGLKTIFNSAFIVMMMIMMYYMSHQYCNKSKSQLTSPTPAQLPAVAVSTGHIVYTAKLYCFDESILCYKRPSPVHKMETKSST